MRVPFNKPYMTGKELWYVSQAHAKGQLAGDGTFTRQCNQWLEQHIGCSKALLTHSCTAALELAAILCEFEPGDEVNMPSYTFVSTANAFVLQGAVPVFVDIREDTLNLDESLIEAAITDRTRAIVPVHYAGVGCDMDKIMELAEKYGLLVIEDDAQGMQSFYKGRPLGSIGHLAAVSFHETKNIISGEGGALLVNDARFAERAEMIREKGTNRSRFLRGQVDKYTWVEKGSSYLPSELVAAFLWAQMEEAESITRQRLDLWNTYHQWFEDLEQQGRIRRPVVPSDCRHNAHMYYLLLRDIEDRSEFIRRMKEQDVDCVFHYIPLHDSPMGSRCSRASGDMSNTISLSERLVRLPMFVELGEHQHEVIRKIVRTLDS